MPGYGLAQGTRGLLTWRWAETRLAKSHNYWLMTTGPKGTPHAMPVWGIWFQGAFYFSTGRQSRKARNLALNPRCVVCNDRADEAVIVQGTAKEVTEPEQIRRLGVPYHAKYKPWKLDPAMGPVYAVRPAVVFGMPEAKFTSGATRWMFAGRSRVK
jgi:nitroimidazol reductase NimA-like FMN-containing flavoprotein (pyridoxamine 5'-phosphate oxidase superfamily)